MPKNGGYDAKWPTISLRLSKNNHDLLKKLAEKRELPLSRFCSDILLSQHCGNCRSWFRRRQSTKIVVELQGFLEATEAELRGVQEENRALQENNQSLVTKIEKRKRYANGINTQTLEKERESKSKHQKHQNQLKNEKLTVGKLQRKLREAEESSKNWEDLYDAEAREKKELWKKISEMEYTIQGYKKRNAILLHEVKKWKARWKTMTEDVSDKLQELAEEVGISQSEVLKDLTKYGLKHSGEIYIEDLEA